jgi:hypothetical protein
MILELVEPHLPTFAGLAIVSMRGGSVSDGRITVNVDRPQRK